MCQALSNEMWVEAQKEHELDIPYYHLIFTCPSKLNPLIYCNQKELYALFCAMSEMVQELLEDSAYLGGRPGFISILHGFQSFLPSAHPCAGDRGRIGPAA